MQAKNAPGRIFVRAAHLCGRVRFAQLHAGLEDVNSGDCWRGESLRRKSLFRVENERQKRTDAHHCAPSQRTSLPAVVQAR
jgi:hypothetical protein